MMKLYVSGCEAEICPLCSRFFGEISTGADSSDRAGFANVEGSDLPNQMLYLDTKIFMASLNRTYNDMLGMASSVEVRVPFLDRELAEFVA